MQQAEQRHEQQHVGGWPFSKGTSGNPEGKSKAAREARKAALMAELSAELGGLAALTPVERTLLGQACGMPRPGVGGGRFEHPTNR